MNAKKSTPTLSLFRLARLLGAERKILVASLFVAFGATAFGTDALADTAACPAPPASSPDIRAIGFYTDPAHTKIDPVLYAENQTAIAPLNDFAQGLATQSDHYLLNSAPDAATCVLSWLDNWATNGAMLGQMIVVNNDQSFYMRQWMHGTVALAYLKTRSFATPGQKQRIEAWLTTLSNDNMQYWQDPNHTQNNHYYWTGVGVMATAIATGDTGLLNTARTIYQKGIDDIQRDGTLPMEIARQIMALHYMSFATAPLVLMAELARLTGNDWYAYRSGSLELLTELVARGYADPTWFNETTGFTQSDTTPSSFSGWAEFFRLRSTNPAAFDQMHAQGPYKDPWMGGNLTLMSQVGIVPGTAVAAVKH